MHRAAALLVLALLPTAAGHGLDHALEAQLTEGGEALLVGSFDAPQPGALLVAPHRAGPLPCGDLAAAGHRVPLGRGEGGVAFLGNATHVAAVLDLPAPGFVALALDTHAAARTLLLMQEQAVALHRLAAAAPNGSAWEARGGVLGIPYALPGATGHGFGDAAPEEVGLRLAYEGAAPLLCAGGASHVTLAVERAVLPSLAPGGVVHAVVLYDAALSWIPRPLPSTEVLQVNLYLARPGEDPAAVRAALDPQPGAHEALPLGLLALGLALVARRASATQSL